MTSLKNKIVLITGASLGIGRETAYKFAREGCRLAITYHKDEAEAFEVVRKCAAMGAAETIAVQLNLADDSSIQNLIDQVVRKFGVISILINNAGVVVSKPLREQTPQEISEQVRVNLEGLIKLTQRCLPYLDDAIISLGSGSSKKGTACLTTYAATKFGVRGFMQALAEEHPHLRILTVNPDSTATRMCNFQGRPPEEVAETVLNTAKGKYAVRSGGDIDIWALPEEPKG